MMCVCVREGVSHRRRVSERGNCLFYFREISEYDDDAICL